MPKVGTKVRSPSTGNNLWAKPDSAGFRPYTKQPKSGYRKPSRSSGYSTGQRGFTPNQGGAAQKPQYVRKNSQKPFKGGGEKQVKSNKSFGKIPKGNAQPIDTPRVRPTNTTPPASSTTTRIPNAGLRPGATSGNILGKLPPIGGQALGALGVAQVAASGQNEARKAARAAGLLPPETPWQKAVREFEENPLPYLNPFSDKWNWAPWNDKKNPKGINPGPMQEKFNESPEPGDYPIEGPQNLREIRATTEPYTRYYKNLGGTSGIWDSYPATNRALTFAGIPIAIRVSFPAGFGGALTRIELVYQDAQGRTETAQITEYQLFSAVPQGTGLVKAPIKYQLLNGAGEIPAALKSTEPIELPKIPDPAYEELDLGQRPQLLEPPDGFPEFPVPAMLPSYPRPLSQSNPPPKTAPRPRPLPPSNELRTPARPLTEPATQPEPQPETAPSDFPDGMPRPKPWTNPYPFPVAPVTPVPMPPPSSNPAGKLESIRKTTTTVHDPYAPSQWQEPKALPKIPDVLTQRLSGPSFPGVPQQSPDTLGQKIDKLSDEIEDKTKRGCRYEEDDLAIAQVTKFTGVEPLTNTPQFATVPMQVHEKLKDYIEFQSQTLAKIEGQADGLRGRVKRIMDRLQILRILNLMSTISTLHNAAMLSRSLADTLGDATSTVITAIGRATGFMSEEEAIDVNQIVGEAFNDLMKSTLGEEVWNGTKQSWLKANRILTSASNIVWSIRSIADSQRAIAEWTAENTGKIGNALKRWGVVGENAYPWMSERVTARTVFQQKIDKFREGVENLDDAASSLSSVAGEVISIQDESQQLKKQWDELEKSVKEGVPNVRPDNDAAKAIATTGKTVSQGKDVSSEDLGRSDNAAA